MYFRRPWGDGWAIRLGSLVAAAESGCPEPDLEVPGVEFRRAKLGFGHGPGGYQLVRVSYAVQICPVFENSCGYRCEFSRPHVVRRTVTGNRNWMRLELGYYPLPFCEDVFLS